MKIAVIIIGRLDFVSQENLELNKRLLKNCDIFIHSSEDYKLKAFDLDPVSVVLTKADKYDCVIDTFHKIYRNEVEEQKKYHNIKHYDPNFNRIIQWIRYEDSLSTFDLENYDVILKWRTDIPNIQGPANEYLKEFSDRYENFEEFFNSSYNSEYFYMNNDLYFAGSLEKMKQCSFFHRIKDFIAKKEEDYEYDTNLLEKCNLKAGKFKWLDSSTKHFDFLFTSESAMIINNLQNNLIMKSFTD